MSIDLGTIANILQLITSITFFAAAWKWGQKMVNKNTAALSLFMLLLAATVVVSGLALASKQGWLPAQKPEALFGKHFRNEIVVLDNREFYNCTFENVELRYGGGHYRLEKVNFIGTLKIVVTEQPIARGIYLYDQLGLIDKNKVPELIPGPPIQ